MSLGKTYNLAVNKFLGQEKIAKCRFFFINKVRNILAIDSVQLENQKTTTNHKTTANHKIHSGIIKQGKSQNTTANPQKQLVLAVSSGPHVQIQACLVFKRERVLVTGQ